MDLENVIGTAEETAEPVSKNFIEMIIEKDLAEGTCSKVITRFPSAMRNPYC